MIIPRACEPLEFHLIPNRVLVIYGPRRVGKTTLLANYLTNTSYKYKLVSGDDIRVRQTLSSQDFSQIISFVEGYQILAIDEAQMIPEVGIGLKIIVDQVPGIRVIATGSSSFELAGQIGEPLTGRKRTLMLFPIAQSELLFLRNRFELRQNLETYLVFGVYPEVIQSSSRSEKIAVITEITNSYLLKDIFTFDRIKHSRTLLHLLQMLAFQIGHEVSLNELATKVSVDVKTVQRYLDLLEKAFVIYRLGGFSRNLRNEVTNKAKYYFLDVGIRNALIAQFNPIDQRNDAGQLWENFMVIERLKYCAYRSIYAHHYFWRTYSQQEIDLIEERDGRLYGYEFKWSIKKVVSAPKNWNAAYPDARFEQITPENYLDFVTG